MHTVTAYRWRRVTAPSILNPELDGDGWSCTRPGRFISDERDGIPTPAENRIQELLAHILVTALSWLRIQRMNGPEVVGIWAPHWSLAMNVWWIISFRNILSKFLRPLRDLTVRVDTFIRRIRCVLLPEADIQFICVVCSVNELFNDVLSGSISTLIF